MNEDELKKMFEDAAAHTPDPQAKKRALNAAMAEFASLHEREKTEEVKNKKQSQGFFRRFRLTSSSDKQNRRQDMKISNFLRNRWLLTGVATACVAFFGVMLTQHHSELKQSIPTEPHKQQDIAANPQHFVVPPPAGDKEKERKVGDNKNLPLPLPAGGPGRKLAAIPQNAKLESNEALSVYKELQKQAEAAQTKLKRGKLDLDYTGPHPSVISVGIPIVGALSKPSKPGMPQPPYPDIVPPQGYVEEGRDRFESFETNPIKRTVEEPVSTFSIDVDTASYSFVRRQLNRGVLPQKDAVRLEEMVNYFDYRYPLPEDRNEPFSRSVTVIDSPWHEKKKLIHIGIKGYEIKDQPKSNLVFLLDVSGSMTSPDKLPLVKQSMKLLLSKLRPDDTVAIAVYAGAAGTVLEPTPVAEKQKIINAIDALRSGGSTAGAQGIKLAYELVEASFDKEAVNRIILATDGDFNVGITNPEELKGFVERKREKGIFLSVLGFGGGNYNDKLMQDLAQNGNGVAAYIDTLSEAQKVLVNEASSTLFPIAKDVKIQVDFNPSTVAEYRLLGYETRKLNREDFNNDAVDAGEIGAGHTVTAIYEITPVGSGAELIDESRYSSTKSTEMKGDEYANLKIRYKLPDEDESRLLTTVIHKQMPASETMKREANFATAVAGFAQLLKDAKYTGKWSFDDALNLAQKNKGEDEFGYRTEFVQLIRKAKVAQGM